MERPNEFVCSSCRKDNFSVPAQSSVAFENKLKISWSGIPSQCSSWLHIGLKRHLLFNLHPSSRLRIKICSRLLYLSLHFSLYFVLQYRNTKEQECKSLTQYITLIPKPKLETQTGKPPNQSLLWFPAPYTEFISKFYLFWLLTTIQVLHWDIITSTMDN